MPTPPKRLSGRPDNVASAGIDAWLQKQALELDIEIGDVLLGGRFKNKRVEVEELGTDELDILGGSL